MTEELEKLMREATIEEIVSTIYECKNILQQRDDADLIVEELHYNGVNISSGFCARKHPKPPRPK